MVETEGQPAAVVDSPVGPLTLAADEQGRLCGVWFGIRSAHRDVAAAGVLAEAARQLTAYFDGRLRTFDLPLAARGSAWQRGVWDELARIPYGTTISYGELARRVGRPDAARAVGAANGANPISIVVPCHRVIGADGRLTGYGGGMANKRFLLDLEAAPAAAQGQLAL